MKSKEPKELKVALVCDWLTNVGGAERVLKTLSDMFPTAPIYTSQYNPKKINWFENCDVRVGWLEIFPSSFRRFLGPLRQLYFNSLNLKDYDLIISVTGAEAKSIKKKGNVIHLCYCHIPTQYYWGMYDDYLKNPGFGIFDPLARVFLKVLIKPLKAADLKASSRPDKFITISTYSSEQIKKYYKRESTIVFPPVAVENFLKRELSTTKIPEQKEIKPEKSQAALKNNKTIKSKKSKNVKTEQTEQKSLSVGSVRNSSERYGFVTTSRHVTWKRLDLAIEACLALNLPLTIIGEGPETKKLKKLAKRSRLIKFLPLMDQKSLKKYLETAEGFIFPSLEPFGIAPVEALAAGCPVIAYGKGGAVDYVIDGENGVLFGKQSVNSLRLALKRFKTLKFPEEKVRNSALPFSEKYFKAKIKKIITQSVKEKLEKEKKSHEKN